MQGKSYCSPFVSQGDAKGRLLYRPDYVPLRLLKLKVSGSQVLRGFPSNLFLKKNYFDESKTKK
jgi:hypothetical protein